MTKFANLNFQKFWVMVKSLGNVWESPISKQFYFSNVSEAI